MMAYGWFGLSDPPPADRLYEYIDQEVLHTHVSRELLPGVTCHRIPFHEGDSFVVRYATNNLLTYFPDGGLRITTPSTRSVHVRPLRPPTTLQLILNAHLQVIHRYSPTQIFPNVTLATTDSTEPCRILFPSARMTLFYPGILYNLRTQQLAYHLTPYDPSESRRIWNRSVGAYIGESREEYGWTVMQEPLDPGEWYHTMRTKVPLFPDVYATLTMLEDVCTPESYLTYTKNALECSDDTIDTGYLSNDFQVCWSASLGRVLGTLGFTISQARRAGAHDRLDINRGCHRMAKLLGLYN